MLIFGAKRHKTKGEKKPFVFQVEEEFWYQGSTGV